MKIFSARIAVPAGSTLAGYQDRIDVPTTAPGELQVHGIAFDGAADGAPWELCGLDALYAGALATRPAPIARVLAASHTHYAPMLDPAKPRLGRYSPQTVAAFAEAIDAALRDNVHPDTCVLLRAELPLPVYRRFDFPDSWANRLLTRLAGFFPNDAHPVDRGLYLLVFMRGEQALASVAYHACHPMTRSDARCASADYVQAVREGVRERFGMAHCLFLLGCNGDVRANFAEKRKAWLPRHRLNWRFKRMPGPEDQQLADQIYRRAVLDAETIDRFALSEDAVAASMCTIAAGTDDAVDVPRLDIGGRVSFTFMPFEVSHRYRLDSIARDGHLRSFIVSCAGNTRGYLPHPSQMQAGGYEVHGSRPYMGEAARETASRT